MIISYNTLLPIDNPNATPLDISITIKPVPVSDNVIKFDVVAIITIVSNDFSFVVIVLNFLFHFFDFLLLSLKKVIIPLRMLIKLLKL